MTRKLICIDCDDTLIHHGPETSYIPDSARSTLRKLREQGHIVALASGRSTFQVEELMKEFDIPHAVCFNGHLVIAGNEVIHNDPLCPGELMPELRRRLAAGETLFAVGQEGIYINDPTGNVRRFMERSMRTGLPQMPPTFSDYYYQMDGSDRDYYFLLIFGKDLTAPRQPDGTVLSYKLWHGEVMEVTNRQTSKLSGIEILCTRLGIDVNDVCAFGDSFNDIEMLQGAGQGIAMGNSPEKLQEVADYVTSEVADDGFYRACLHLGLIK